MTNSSEYSAKSEAFYRVPDDINNFKISVTFDDETRHFRWQQKIFGRSERDFYSDEKNCLTDLECKYHQEISKLAESDGVLFSYTNRDGYISGDEVSNELSRRIRDEHEREETKEFDFAETLKASLGNPVVYDTSEVMYIMADLGEYVDDVWIKSEHVLCTMKYDKERKILAVNPDFSKSKPYLLQVNADSIKNYCYFIENACEEIDEEDFLKEERLYEKLISEKVKLRREIVGDKFEIPTKHSFILFLEIAKARHFENDNIYIRYVLDLPENWCSNDASDLTGTTQSCHVTTENQSVNFGFTFELTLQLRDEQDSLKCPYIYFEVISKDTWSRFRTEGLAYQCLPVFKPGCWEFKLHCVRICPEGAAGALRRFFIGDCGAYGDVSWVGLPKDHEEKVINKYGVKTIPTGELFIKLNVIHQKNTTTEDVSATRDFLFDKLQSSNLLKSVADVVRAFKKARKNMIEARKNL